MNSNILGASLFTVGVVYEHENTKPGFPINVFLDRGFVA
jgi:hypothetical protein